MLASWSTSSRMRVAASSTSNSVMSRPPVIEISRPLAPRMEVSSSSGLAMALLRPPLAIARPSPDGFAGAHHGLAHLAHHRTDVGEVEVDQAFLDHQVGDAGNAGIEHLVGHREGVGEGRLVVGDAEQVLVRNDDQRVDALLQLLDAGFGQCACGAGLRSGTAW
jgi:hypothetical protein